MSRDLYFIPILQRALDRAERSEALQDAFVEIAQLGHEVGYRRGLSQFQRFMAEAHGRQVPNVYLEKDGEILAQFVPSRTVEEVRVPQILPGSYSIRFDTGRLIWAGEFAENDLLWFEAFPLEALQLAADSEQAEQVWTRELVLLQEEIVMRVYPGIESGTIGIRIDRWKQT